MSGLPNRSADTIWLKSSYSSSSTGCVEVAITDAAVGVRDSKNRTGSSLVFKSESWAKFIASLKE